MKRLAFIMAGGGGERFWPLSTPARPKQLLKLAHPDKTLLRQTIERAEPLVGRDALFVATAAGLEDAIRQAEPSFPPANILSEPARRNTLGCMVWTAAHARARHGGECVLGYITADQDIRGDDAFRTALDACYRQAAETGALMVIGIAPTRPETGYGYIEAGDADGDALAVRQYREKPDRATAERFLADGGFYWNSGMFFWTVEAFESALSEAQPEAASCCGRIAEALAAGDDAGAVEAFNTLPSISIDYALMEKARNRAMVVGGFHWDDVGAWDAMERTRPLDAGGNVVEGAVFAQDCRRSILCNESTRAVQVAVLGVEDLVVVVTDDSVLVAPKSKSQSVRDAAKHFQPSPR